MQKYTFKKLFGLPFLNTDAAECLFCLFVTEVTQYCVSTGSIQGGHCCNSGIFCGASPRCFPYTITWTEESTCNARHGIGIWSAERHWEADPTTAGRGHF